MLRCDRLGDVIVTPAFQKMDFVRFDQALQSVTAFIA
jgi:hypothetical protein